MVETTLTPDPSSNDAPAGRSSLKQRAILGAAWTLGGQGGMAALRLASNLILTRLLFPEAFGLMALVNVAVLAAEMSSDLGFRGSVISNRRADEPRFLDTVWTVKIVRGLLVTIAVALASPLVAAGYETPALSLLLGVSGLRIAINGFMSTSTLTLLRWVQPARRILLDLGSQAISVAATVALAIALESVWALVLGDLLLALLRAAGSHFLVPGSRNRFAWDRSAVRDVFGFGRWIWVSSVMTYLLLQGDRAVLGTMMNAGELGVYSVAFALCSMIIGTAQQLSGNLLFPVYSELAREADGSGPAKIRRTRALVLSAFLPPLCLLIVSGPSIIDVLYDDRYVEAGWMLQILAAGAIPQILVSTAERGLLAFGDSFRHMALQISSASLFVLGLACGALLGGTAGLMIGGAAARLVAYLPYWGLSRKYGFQTPLLDLMALGGAALVCGASLAALGSLP